MGHHRLSMSQSILFVHAIFNTVQTTHIEQIRIPISTFSIHFLTDVTSHPNGNTIFQQFLSNRLHFITGDIQVNHRGPTSNILKIVYGVGLVVCIARIVDDTDIISPININIFRSKFLWRHLAFAVEFVILVSPLPIKTCGGSTQMNTQHVPNVRDTLFFVGPSLIEAPTIAKDFANFTS